jgi:hypothetical protein
MNYFTRENSTRWYSFFAESLDTAKSKLQHLQGKSPESEEIREFNGTEEDEPSDPRDIAASSALRSALGESNTIFRINTTNDGFNSGRIYYIRANSILERDRLIEKLEAISETASKRMFALTRYVHPIVLNVNCDFS